MNPAEMGSGPIPAPRTALENAGWKVKDLDLVEANEAFAAQAIAVNKDMSWDPSIVNVAAAPSPWVRSVHPACVLTTLLFQLQRGAKEGLATLCMAGGVGVALKFQKNRSETRKAPRGPPTTVVESPKLRLS